MNGTVGSKPTDDDRMISASKRPLRVPQFKEAKDKSLFCSRLRGDGVSEYTVAHGREVVVLLESGATQQRYEVDFLIKKVFWISFPPSKSEAENAYSQEFFCIVGVRDIVFYASDDCHPLNYHVPFDMRNVYATNHGMLVERNWLSEDDYKNTNVELVYIYSISHPLNEMLPVIYKPKDSLTQWMFCWERDELTVVDSAHECLLIFDRINQVHRIYRVRETSESEVRSTLRMIDKRCDLQSTPIGTVPGDGCIGLPISRSVHTRSMTAARLARTRTFPVESPALSTMFSPMSFGGHSDLDTPSSFRLRPLSHNSTPRLQTFSRVLERDPDIDLLLAELCLELVWTEPAKRDVEGVIADKMFMSRSVISHSYINFFLHSLTQLRSIRIMNTTGNITTSGPFHILACRDATYIQDGSTIVLELDNSIGFYSGLSKVAVVIIPRFTVNANMHIFPSAVDSFCLLDGADLLKILIPPAYTQSSVKNLFRTLTDALSQEKASSLICDWRTRFSSREFSLMSKCLNPELHMALRFVLEQAGFSVGLHPKLPWIKTITSESEEINAKQRRPKSSGEENWQQLLRYGDLVPPLNSTISEVNVVIDAGAPLHQHVFSVLGALHSLFEEWSLDCGMFTTKAECVYYLHIAFSILKQPVYYKLYEREFPQCASFNYIIQRKNEGDIFPSPNSSRNFSIDRSFSLWESVEAILESSLNHQLQTTSSKSARWLTVLAVSLGHISMVVDLHRMLGKNWAKKLHLTSRQHDDVTCVILDRSLTAAQKCDKLMHCFCFSRWDLQCLPPSIGLLLGRVLMTHHVTSDLLLLKRDHPGTNFPSLLEMNQIARLRWPVDIRMENVRTMLDSSKPVLIATQHLIATNDSELREAQETFLSATCVRYLAQAFGRALFDFRTELPSPTEALSLPDLCLSARIYPTNITFDLQTTDPLKHLREWGEFFNGVVAGLRVVGSETIKVDNEWMMMCHLNEKVCPSAAAGMLLGFGLNGHIVNMNMFHVHELLSSLDKFQSIALLLGFSVAKMGSGDRQVHKVLTTHLPFLMGPTMLDIKIDPLIQTSAISSLGLLFAETGHMNIVHKLLNEIGKSPMPEEEPAADRPAYKLSAGFSVGLICLGLGDDITKSTPPFQQPLPSVTDRLLVMMSGGPRSMCVFPHQTQLTVTEFPLPPGHVATPPVSNHVKESPNVNVHLTGHPATIALGLMYLRTGNKAIARELALPETITLLEAIRPDLILVRSLSRCLVLWDEIEPSSSWIEAQVPLIVRDYMKASLKWGEDDDIIVTEPENNYWDEIVDRETIAQVFVYAITGACFALALKYVSTGSVENDRVLFLLTDYINIFLPDNPRRTHQRVCEYAGLNVSSLCSDMLLISMALVMTSYGDMSTIQMARLFRMKEQMASWVRSPRKHHEQCEAHRALALMFLGKGRYAFKRDNLSIALLIISFYPIINHNVADNRLYHQPLRFMWVRAIEPRLLVPVCRQTGRVIRCEMKMWLKRKNEPIICHAPFLLPSLDDLSAIEVGGASLEIVRFDLTKENRRKELESVLNQGYGRLQLSTTGIDLNEDELSEEPGWSLDDIFSRSDQYGLGGESEPTDETTERLTAKLSNPLSSSRVRNNLSWQQIESVPALRQYLKTLQMEITGSPECVRNFVSRDVQLASIVALHGKEEALGWRLEMETKKMTERS